ncbi:MAG: polysaccharide deacetylase family protein [Ktedonobacterales bacterium]
MPTGTPPPLARGRQARRGRRRTVLALLLATAIVVLAASGAAYASFGGALPLTLGPLPFSFGVVGVPSAGSSAATATSTATPISQATPVAHGPHPWGNSFLNTLLGCPAMPLSNVVYDGRDAAAGHAAPNEVALTFDDGPSPTSSPPILDFLERTHTPATFFVIGNQVAADPALIQREWRDGFAIGVHTWNHPDMRTLSVPQLRQQFGDTLAAMRRALGANACIWLWRPPYGSYNSQVVQTAATFGLTTIMWNDDPADWSRPGVAAIVRTVLAEVHPGSIILLHDGPALREQTLAALPLILAGLQQRGLQPVTLPRLLADGGYPGIRATPGSH